LLQFVPPAIVCTGELLLVVVLSPKPPRKLLPQVHNVPSVFIAVVLLLPVATEIQLVPPAIVCTGELLLVGVLSPNCPLELLPQVKIYPSAVKTPENSSPQTILTIGI
jgi:hypothetical protein